MTEPNPQPEKPKAEPRFNQEQYDMLKQCSDKKDMTEWNEWRKKNSGKNVELEGADFTIFYLKQALLLNARMEGAKLRVANLTCANLGNAHLEGANLCDTNLEGANLNNSHLQGAHFRLAVVSGFTSLCYAQVDPQTDFREVGLDSVRIDPATKQLLEYNIRRKNWEEWYPKRNWLLAWAVRAFWWMSDYGISTWRIIRSFFVISMVFAIVYYLWGAIEYYYCGVSDNPGIVANLFIDENGPIEYCLVPIRSIYFSIVTMTTLGFGDMYANAHNCNWGWLGHIILSVQVILGYVLLGALVTRFAVLFTAGGPAGRFSD